MRSSAPPLGGEAGGEKKGVPGDGKKTGLHPYNTLPPRKRLSGC